MNRGLEPLARTLHMPNRFNVLITPGGSGLTPEPVFVYSLGFPECVFNHCGIQFFYGRW